MAGPVRGRLRPAARPGGLTRPDPVTAPASGPPRPPRPPPPTRKDHCKAAQRRPTELSRAQSPGETPRAEIGLKTIYRNSPVDSGLGRWFWAIALLQRRAGTGLHQPGAESHVAGASTRSGP
jgi:hypothetical protein